jgi:hypothetical protein
MEQLSKRPPRAITKLMKHSGALAAHSLGDLKGPSTGHFTHQQNGRHICTFIKGAEIQVCTKCGATKPL